MLLQTGSLLRLQKYANTQHCLNIDIPWTTLNDGTNEIKNTSLHFSLHIDPFVALLCSSVYTLIQVLCFSLHIDPGVVLQFTH